LTFFIVYHLLRQVAHHHRLEFYIEIEKERGHERKAHGPFLDDSLPTSSMPL